MTKIQNNVKRVLIGIVGGFVLLAGIIMIPYPGPGWLVVFAGLGILSTEFEWAQRVLLYARGKYDMWQAWLSRQNSYIKALFWVLTALVVVVTIWLLNGYGVIDSLLGLDQAWVHSPIRF